MNKELLDSMRKQMSPSPDVRAALTKKLAQPAKKRPAPWKRYGAVAACAALVIGTFTVYSYSQDSGQWMFFLRSFNRGSTEVSAPLHSYVTVEGPTGTIQENATTTETGGGDTGTPNTGALPGGTYIGDAPSQEEAVNAYEKLMDRFDGQYPDWYGGAYIDRSGWLVVQLVEDKDPADKSLELQVLDWTDDGHIMFSSCKYSLSYLRDLQDKVCDAMTELGLFSSCGADEERNRLDLTLTSVTDEALILLARLDPDDDAIYVQVGQRASHDLGEDVRTDSAKTEDPAVRHVMPGGTPAPDDEDLIAEEPQVDGLDGTHYDIRDLPEEKKPSATDSAPEEDSSADTSAFTPAYDPDAGFISPKE